VKVLERFALTGKKALVTGGNQGLGKAFAAALAEAGARVVIVARDAGRNAAAVRELAGQGLEVSSIDADITRDADGTVQRAVEELGGLDVLVNNAGLCIHKESWQVTDEEWTQVFDLNVRALWKCSLAGSRHMARSGGGSIVWSGGAAVQQPDRGAERGGGEGHEDAGLDELEGPEPVGGLVGDDLLDWPAGWPAPSRRCGR
jgi:NAD(P)-dependent dehydrogenase (short-subunit alcohol dehydrogenase family)